MRYLLILFVAVSGLAQDAVWGRRNAFRPKAASGSGTVSFQDEFTEASNTSLTNHVPTTTGTGWSTLSGTFGNSRWIVNGASDIASANASANSTLEAVLSDSVPSSDYDVSVKLSGVYSVNFNDDSFHIIGRCSGSVSNLYAIAVYPNFRNPNLVLYKIVSGTVTDLDTQELDVSVNDVVVLELRTNSQRVLINGVEQLSATDSSLTSAGSPGLALGSLRNSNDDVQTAWNIDNYKVTYY